MINGPEPHDTTTLRGESLLLELTEGGCLAVPIHRQINKKTRRDSKE